MVSAFWQECCVVVVPGDLTCCCLPRFCPAVVSVCLFVMKYSRLKRRWISLNIEWKWILPMKYFTLPLQDQLWSDFDYLSSSPTFLSFHFVSSNCLFQLSPLALLCILYMCGSYEIIHFELWLSSLHWKRFFFLLIRFIHFHNMHKSKHSELLKLWWSVVHSR